MSSARHRNDSRLPAVPLPPPAQPTAAEPGLRYRRWADPLTWYVVLASALIITSLWVPWRTAVHTARIEYVADHIARLLLAAAGGVPEPTQVASREHLLARFHALGVARGIPLADIEVVAEPAAGVVVCLRNEHYAFQLALSPPAQQTPVVADGEAALEVIAWPLAVDGLAHSVYFYADNEVRAYTRNLTSGYVGLGARRPRPGVARQVLDAPPQHPSSYRSATDERWIYY